MTLVIILAPFYLFLFNVSDNDLSENRLLSERPVLKTVSELPDYLRKFDTFFSDNFPFRAKAIFALSYIKYFVFGVSAHQDIVIGKNNMMYYFTKSSGDTIGDYRGINYFTREELKTIETNILERMNLFKKLNIDFYLVFTPNKESIYPEFVPDYVRKYKNRNRFDQLVEHLKKNKEIPFLSLKENLLLEKSNHTNLYYYYDTHWNPLGAYFGYKGIVDFLQKDYPSILIRPISDFEIKEVSASGDLAGMIGLGGTLFEQSVSLMPTFKKKAKPGNNIEPHNFEYDTEEKTFPNAYFFCDSFVVYGPRDLLAESFHKSYFIWHGLPHNSDKISFSEIDIFVFELSERYIDMLRIPVKNPSKPWVL